MRLLKMTLENFKGIKRFELNLKGKSARVNAVNGAGKTTLKDAYLWLLFGKDSNGSAPEAGTGFELKPRDANGNEIHGLDSVVEGTFLHEGKTIVLRRVFSEVWTKPKGQGEKVFSGNTTAYFTNEVPVQMGEYEAYIKSLIQDEIRFRLVSDTSYFSGLNWKEQRKIINGLASTATIHEIILAYPELVDIEELLNEHGEANALAIMKSRRKTANDAIQKIPIRIDEVNRGLNEPAESFDFEALKAKREQLTGEKEEVNQVKQGLAQKEMDRKQGVLKEMDRVRTEMDAVKARNVKAMAFLEDAKRKIIQVEATSKNAAWAIEDIEQRISGIQADKAELVSEKLSYKKDYDALQALKNQEVPFDTVCALCGQELPEDQQLENREIAANRLKDDLEKQSKALIEKAKALNVRIEKFDKRIEDLLGQSAIQKTALAESEASRNSYEIVLNQKVQLESLEEFEAELERLNLLADTRGVDTSVQDEQLDLLEEQLRVVNLKMAQIETYEAAKKRVEELRIEERELGAKIVEIDKQILLIEKFVQCQAQVNESAINSMFKTVTFQMFTTQQNGAITDVFIPRVKGQKYSTNANTAAKIDADLEIIEALSRSYGLEAPVFIDHAESVTGEMYHIASQTIKLRADERFDALAVEVEE